MPNNDGTLIIAPIRPQSPMDNFPSAYANELLGGHHQVANVAARDAIPTERLSVGMFCTTQDTNTVYILDSIGPNVWVEFTSGSGSSSQNLSGFITLNTVDNVYTIGHPAISGQSLPIVSLVSPDDTSILYVSAITNVMSNGFDVVLSGVPSTSGYQINWTNGTLSTISLSGGGVFVHDQLTGLGDDDHTQYLLADGSREISGSLIPSTSGTLDLGSAAQPFRELYVTENSVYMGSHQLSVVGGKLTFDGDEVGGDLSAEVAANTAAISANTANIATNTSDIGQNTADIGQLGTDIGDNATDILSLQGDVSAIQGDYVDLSSAQTISGAKTFFNDVVINSDLYVNGTNFIVNTTNVSASDNTITINAGEVGAGVTAGVAGIVVDRGTATNYQFVFTESSDTFRIGEIGSEQAVATREDSPINGGVAIWDNSTSKFNTSLNYVDRSSTQNISGDKTFNGDTSFTGTVYLNDVSSSIIPSASGTLDLGSISLPFKDIYSSETIFIGSDTLSTSSGVLLVNGSPVQGGSGVTDHGALTGLGDDDHTQYLLADGSRDISGSLIPSTSGTLDLGSAARPFDDAYLSDTLFIGSDTITVSGGILLVNGTQVQGSGGGSADTATYTAGENISGGDLCYQETDGSFYKVDSTVLSKSSGFLAFATENILSSNTGTFQIKGTLTDGTLTPSSIYYASTGGSITDTPDVTTEGVIVRVVGYGLPNGDLFISPDQTWVTVGFGAEVEVYTAGENISGGDLCYQHTDGSFYKTDASVAAKSTGLLAIALDNIASAATGNFRFTGEYIDGSLAVGRVYYVSNTLGGITITPDITTEDNIVRIVGYGLSNGNLRLSIDETWVTVGTGLENDHGSLDGLSDDDHPQYLLASGSREISGSLIPSTSGTLDLGSVSQPFRDLYISENSMYLGSNKLSVSGGILQLNDSNVDSGGSQPTETKTANFTAQVGYRYYLNGSAAPYTATIPTAVGNAFAEIEFITFVGNTKVCTLNPNGSQTIGGVGGDNYKMTFGDRIVIMSDGANWIIKEKVGNVRVYADSNSSQVLTVSSTLVQYEDNISDPYAAWTGNNTFTAPRKGYYNVNATVGTGSSVTSYSLQLYINGSFHVWGPVSDNDSFSRVISIDKTVFLEEGDTLTILTGMSVTRDATTQFNKLAITEVS